MTKPVDPAQAALPTDPYRGRPDRRGTSGRSCILTSLCRLCYPAGRRWSPKI